MAEGNVWLVRGCTRHGKVITLYDEHPEIMEYLEQWTAPTKYHLPDTEGNYDPIANRIADDDLPAELRAAVKASLLGLLSEQTSLSHPTMGELIQNICESCDLGITSLMRLAAGSNGSASKLRDTLATRVKRITVKPFMDMNTMIEERLIQCGVHVGTRSEADLDQCAPFCAVQAWPGLGRQKVAESAGARVGSVPLVLQPTTEVPV